MYPCLHQDGMDFLCQMDKVYSNLILHFFAMLHRKSHTVNLEMFPVVSGFLI